MGFRGMLFSVLAAVTLAVVFAAGAAAQDAVPAVDQAAAAIEQAAAPIAVPVEPTRAGDLTSLGRALWWIAPLGSIIALIVAFAFYKNLMSRSEGTEKMREIAGHVRKGADAYLRQQYKVVGLIFIILALIFAFLAYVAKAQNPFVPFAFLTGGFFSGLSGFLGMKTATRASARTAAAAQNSLNQGLTVAFRSGAVMGLVVVGLGLLDIAIWYSILTSIYTNGFHWSFINIEPITDMHQRLNVITTTMLTFGMGASTQALFARVGGGIFTKAADVGADLVGKVEAGIPEDDPRNPAVIADNVGDNVGDVAGMGADLYESYCGSILATAALGVAAGAGLNGVVLPMVIAGVGTILSIVGMFVVRTKEDAGQKELMAALNRGIFFADVPHRHPVGRADGHLPARAQVGRRVHHRRPSGRRRHRQGGRVLHVKRLPSDAGAGQAVAYRPGDGHHRRLRARHALDGPAGHHRVHRTSSPSAWRAASPTPTGASTAWASPRSACFRRSASRSRPTPTVRSPTTRAATPR